MEENKLKQTIEAIFSDNRPTYERTITGYRGCIVRGYVNIDDFSHCDNDRCESCNMVNKALEDVITQMNFKPYEEK